MASKASKATDELRCRRTFFGRRRNGVDELYCRSCSRARSREGRPVTVYHRWKPLGPHLAIRLDDLVVEGRPQPRRE